MNTAAGLIVLSLATLALGASSRRLKRRRDAVAEPMSYSDVRYSMLHILLFPLAGLLALIALGVIAVQLLEGEESPEMDVDDGCGSVELALEAMSSNDPTDRAMGAAVAAEVRDRMAREASYSTAVGRDCPLEVQTMIDRAGLSDGP